MGGEPESDAGSPAQGDRRGAGAAVASRPRARGVPRNAVGALSGKRRGRAPDRGAVSCGAAGPRAAHAPMVVMPQAARPWSCRERQREASARPLRRKAAERAPQSVCREDGREARGRGPRRRSTWRRPARSRGGRAGPRPGARGRAVRGSKRPARGPGSRGPGGGTACIAGTRPGRRGRARGGPARSASCPRAARGGSAPEQGVARPGACATASDAHPVGQRVRVGWRRNARVSGRSCRGRGWLVPAARWQRRLESGEVFP